MDDLFDIVKAAPPPIKVRQTPPPLPVLKDSSPVKFVIESSDDSLSNDHLSIAAETSLSDKKIRQKSLTPISLHDDSSQNATPTDTISTVIEPAAVKPFKVILERYKPNSQSDDGNDRLNATWPTNERTTNNLGTPTTTTTPTKAQQKLFEPAFDRQAKEIAGFKIKRCVVRLHRSNLEDLMNKSKRKGAKPNSNKSLTNSKSKNNDKSSSRQNKHQKPFLNSSNSNKETNKSFFIKLTHLSPPTSSTAKKSLVSKLSPSSNGKMKAKEKRSASFAALSLKERNLKKTKSPLGKSKNFSPSTTRPTKFTRTQLIKDFGIRYFHSFVKIERCSHPLMLTFESNARARKLKAKRNKSKNLTVSFSEQVEIIGDTDSDSDDGASCGYADNETVATSSSKATQLNDTGNKQLAAKCTTQRSQPVPAVMPARLKKVENGKVIDDIELDVSLFIDPKEAPATSTPFIGRKKRSNKSFSPLKCDADTTPSPRREKLKLANERLPPSVLRRLSIDDMDDDDDQCEYIVPNEIPERRSSRASSLGVSEELSGQEKTSKTSFNGTIEETEKQPEILQLEINEEKEKQAAEIVTANTMDFETSTKIEKSLDEKVNDEKDTEMETEVQSQLTMDVDTETEAEEKTQETESKNKENLELPTITITEDLTTPTKDDEKRKVSFGAKDDDSDSVLSFCSAKEHVDMSPIRSKEDNDTEHTESNGNLTKSKNVTNGVETPCETQKSETQSDEKSNAETVNATPSQVANSRKSSLDSTIEQPLVPNSQDKETPATDCTDMLSPLSTNNDDQLKLIVEESENSEHSTTSQAANHIVDDLFKELKSASET